MKNCNNKKKTNNNKITPLTVKNLISKFFKSLQVLTVQGSLNPNITFLGEKLWSVAWNKKNTNVI